MKIATKLYLNAIVTIASVAMLATVLLITSNEIAAKSRTYEAALEIEKTMTDLNILTFEYFMFGETRMEAQWLTKYNSMERLFQQGENTDLFEAVVIDHSGLSRLFRQLTLNREKRRALIQKNAPKKNIDLALQLEERLISRLLITSQAIYGQASTLAQTSYVAVGTAQNFSFYSTITLVVILTIIITTTSILIAKNISGQLKNLTDGADRTAQGELDFQIDARNQDELGHLANTFNKMLRMLLEYRKGLEHQVAERTKQLEETNERLARSNLELDDFAYIASHDLQEPLRGISNYATFIQEDYEDQLDEDGKHMLTRMSKLANRMQLFIDNLLEYSRLGRTEMAIGYTNLHTVISDTIDDLSASLQEYNVTCTIDETLPSIICDHVRMAEVFRNLITNAMKYNAKKEKHVHIGCDNNQEPYVFYVQDNGISIAENLQNKVFKIFKRLHHHEEYGGGSGAGLAIVRKIIEQHKGEIWIESQEGEGTKFLFTIALKPTDIPTQD